MRVMWSLGLTLALGSLAEARSRSQTTYEDSVDSFSQMDEKSSQMYGQPKDRYLNKAQSKLVTDWKNMRKADSYADMFDLHLTYRFSIYSSSDAQTSEKPFAIEDLGPNSKAELIKLFLDLISSQTADSPNAMYTALPPSYLKAYKSSSSSSGKKTTVVTTTTSPSGSPQTSIVKTTAEDSSQDE